MKSIEIVFCLILGVTFMASSVPKLRFPRGFVLTVLQYQVLPPSIGCLYGWMLPPLELLVAIFLLTGTAVHIAAIVTVLLLVSFTVAVGINIVRGRDLDCHCFGTKAQRSIGWPLVLQDGLLLGAAVGVVFLTSALPLVEPWSVFRINEIDNYVGFLPFLVNLGLTSSITMLLRLSKSRGRWFPG